MAHEAHMTEHDFFIKKEDFCDAYQALMVLTELLCKFTCSELAMVDSLPSLLAVWGWNVGRDFDTGDITSLDFEGPGGAHKIYHEDQIFATIAPYVKDGSYIEMYSDSRDDSWRWVFRGGELITMVPEITWVEGEYAI